MIWTERQTAVLDHQMRYMEAGTPGSANAVLLLHAFPIGVRLWESQKIPDGWWAVAPALPGFDGSALPPAESTAIDDFSHAAIALMDALHIPSFVVGGVSMGGYTTFGVVRHAASRCRAIILADTRAEPDTDAARASRDAMIARVRAEGPAAIANEMIPKLLGATTLAQRPALVARVRSLMEGQSIDGIVAALLRVRNRPDSTAVLRQIQVPALVVVGEEDTFTPRSDHERMLAGLPNGRMAVVPEAGHYANMENPGVFDHILSQFLGKLSA